MFHVNVEVIEFDEWLHKYTHSHREKEAYFLII